MPRYLFLLSVWTRAREQQNLLQLAARLAAEFGTGQFPCHSVALFTGRKIFPPSLIFAAAIHESILTFTAAGMVTVRTRFPFPTRSGMAPATLALLDAVDFEANELGASQPHGIAGGFCPAGVCAWAAGKPATGLVAAIDWRCREYAETSFYFPLRDRAWHAMAAEAEFLERIDLPSTCAPLSLHLR